MVATTMMEAARPEYVKIGQLPPGLEALGDRAVVQAVETITSDATFDQVCLEFLRIIEQHSGCQRALLLLRRESSSSGDAPLDVAQTAWHKVFYVNAMREDGADSVFDTASSGALDVRSVPFSLLDLCATNMQFVIVADVLSDPVFRADPHFAEHKVRSAMAVPIIRSAVLLGLVYLEHQFASGVFHPAGAKTIALLCDQLSISIELSRTFNSLKAREKQLEIVYSMIKHAHSAAERFVPKAILRHIGRSNAAEAQLGDAAELDLTVIFSDVRDFTSICEGRTARGAIEFLNGLLRVVVPCIDQYGGCVDKFLGDGTLSIFRTAADALRAARLIQLQLRLFRAESSQHAPWPDIQMGIGIHSGPVVLGCVGTDTRLNVTVVGDTVNLASRFENITKLFGAKLIVSEDTLRQSLPREFHGSLEMVPFVRSLGLVLVKGKTLQCRIFEVFEDTEALRASGFDEAAREVERICAAKQDFYYAQHLWKCGHGAHAKALFQRLAASCPFDTVAHRHVSWIESQGGGATHDHGYVNAQQIAIKFRKNGTGKLVHWNDKQ